MSLFAQHGYGKGDKLERLGNSHAIDGVILSPADEGAAALRQTARDLRLYDVTTLLDPQTYVYAIPDAVARSHEENGLDFGTISWGSLTTADVGGHAASVVAVNEQMGTDGPIIAPGPRQLSFADPWTPFAFQYARATLEVAQGRPVLASLIIEEAGLGDWSAIEQWLDMATTLDVAGFYIVVGRHGNYPSAWDGALLANLGRLVYRLAVLNDYHVIVGYSDIAGLVSIAVGAEAIASGWSYRQRHFLAERWIPRRGGQPASPRVTAIGLMAPLLAVGEGQAASRSARGDRVIDDPLLRRRIATDPASWTNPEAQMQFLETLSSLVGDLEALRSAAERVAQLQDLVARSRSLATDLARDGVHVDAVHRSTLAAIASATETIQKAERL